MPTPPTFSVYGPSVNVAAGLGSEGSPMDIRTYTLNPTLYLTQYFASNGTDTQFVIAVYDETNNVDIIPVQFLDHGSNEVVTVDGSNLFDLYSFQGTFNNLDVYRLTLYSFEPNPLYDPFDPFGPPEYLYADADPIFIRYVDDIQVTKYFGDAVTYGGGYLKIQIDELGSTVSPGVTNIDDPANIDACGLILGLLERLIEKQDDAIVHWPVEVNKDLVEEIPLTSAATIYRDGLATKAGKVLRYVEFVVRIHYRQNEPIEPI